MKREKGVRRLSKYIQVSFTVFSVVPMILACCLCMVLVIGIYERNSRQVVEMNVRNAGENLEQWLDDYTELLRTCAENKEIIAQMQSARTLDNSACAVVNALLTGRSSGLQLHLLSSNGTFRYSTGSIPNLYKMPTYRDVGIFARIRDSASTGVIRATKYTAYNGRQVALMLGIPVRNAQGSEIGFALLDIYRDELADMLGTYDTLMVTDMLLADENRTVAYSRSGHFQEGLTLQDDGLLKRLNEANPGLSIQNNVYRIALDSGRLALLVTASSEFGYQMYRIVLFGLAGMLVIAIAIASFSGKMLSEQISSQINRLLEAMRLGPHTGFNAKYICQPGDFSEIIQLGDYYNIMNAQTRSLIASIEDKQRLLANAELNILKMQIRPHFVYNVLNDIKSMAKLSRTQEITELVVCFSALMRCSLATEEEFCTLSEELDLVKKYVHMQNLRTMHQVDLRVRMDESLASLEIPRLILEPLVENSLSHGLPGVSNPIIRVRCCRQGEKICLTVADNGSGVTDPDKLKPMDGLNYHTGIGLSNIEQRLRLYYGENGRLNLRSKPGRYTIVTLTMMDQHQG